MAAHILILYTLPEGADLLLNSLRSTEYITILVNNVDAALENLKTKPIDLIISQVHLKEASSFEFLTIVKKDPQSCNIPFIFLRTSHSQMAKRLDEILASAANIIGGAEYITVDETNTEDLRNKVENCLRQSKRENNGQ
jgi:CheY-like chemotaxis protein